MLSDHEIIEAIKADEIRLVIERDGTEDNIIDPTTGQEKYCNGSLQPHGYDLRIAAVRKPYSTEWKELKDVHPSKGYILDSWETVEIRTIEKLALNELYGGTLHSLAYLRAEGLSPISGTIHPKWGHGTQPRPKHLHILVTNMMSKSKIKLTYNQPFCRIVFYRLGSKAQRWPPTWEEGGTEQTRRIEEEQKKVKRQRLIGTIFILISIVDLIGLTFILHNAEGINGNSGLQSTITTALITAFILFFIPYLNRKYKVLNTLKT